MEDRDERPVERETVVVESGGRLGQCTVMECPAVH